MQNAEIHVVVTTEGVERTEVRASNLQSRGKGFDHADLRKNRV